MKFPQLFIFFILLQCSVAFSQKVIKHSVKSGESIYSIAKKYDVTEKEVFELNPKLKGSVLGLKTIVQIPNKKYKAAEKKEKSIKGKIFEEEVVGKNDPVVVSHLVSAKETLYSISKNYGISMEEICELNPELKAGTLKAGARIKLPSPDAKVVANKPQSDKTADQQQQEQQQSKNTLSTANSEGDVIHKVLPKETFYGISKQYGVTILDLHKNNPSVENGLPVGYMLIVKKGSQQISPVQETVVVVKDSLEISDEIEDDGADDIMPLSAENLSKVDFLISKASENIGTRYRSGGTTTAGFDCSGFMCYTFNNIDLKLPRSSHEMAGFGTKIKKRKAQKGDLIFFATMGRKRISHVGMITEVLDDEIKFIHSSTSSGVIISSTKENYYARTYVQINRVLKN